MNRAHEAKDSVAESHSPADNAALDEAVWQKWMNKNKERDAARRRRLIRILWIVLLLFLVGVVVWRLTTST